MKGQQLSGWMTHCTICYVESVLISKQTPKCLLDLRVKSKGWQRVGWRIGPESFTRLSSAVGGSKKLLRHLHHTDSRLLFRVFVRTGKKTRRSGQNVFYFMRNSFAEHLGSPQRVLPLQSTWKCAHFFRTIAIQSSCRQGVATNALLSTQHLGHLRKVLVICCISMPYKMHYRHSHHLAVPLKHPSPYNLFWPITH